MPPHPPPAPARPPAVAHAPCPAAAARPGDARTSLVAAERAFARLSVDSGAQAAFLANLAEDAVLFRPGPVPGRAYQQAHPIPTAAGTLDWTPQWAAVSRAGDVGVTSGPWTITRDGRVVAHGTFNSVWVRPDAAAAGRWRVLLDVGAVDSSTARRPTAVAGVAACGPVAAVASGRALRTAAGAGVAEAAVWRADSLAGRADGGAGAGLAAALAPDARLVREHAPVRSAAAARDDARRVAARLTSVPLAVGVARSGDLAYSYGAYTLAPPATPGVPAERGHYLRVWRAGAGGWALVLDVTNPLPAPPAPAAP